MRQTARGSTGAGVYHAATPHQGGSALTISLMMLTLMTLIGVTAIHTTLLQERMAGNMRDRALAFEAAEAALRTGEAFVAANPGVAASGASGVWLPSEAGEAPRWKRVNWAPASAEHRALGGSTFDQLSRPPSYIIETLAITAGAAESLAADEPLPELRRFRITAAGWGGSEGTRVMLQSVYRLQ